MIRIVLSVIFMNIKTTIKRKKESFTLVELLVVMSILAILMSLFVPALRRTLYAAKKPKVSER